MRWDLTKGRKKNSVALRVFLDLPNFLPYLHGIFSSNFSLTCNTSYWKFPRGTMLCVISMCSLPLQLYLTLWDPKDWSPPVSSVHEDSPGKNTREGCHALLQGIFPTQGWNLCLLCLLHWKWILYHWARGEACDISIHFAFECGDSDCCILTQCLLNGFLYLL